MKPSKICIGYGKYENKCKNKAGTPWTPHWCLRCDTLRRKTITKNLEEIHKSFKEYEDETN